MIRRQGAYQAEVRERMRGGTGFVRIEHYWKQDELKGKTRLCARLILEPGASIGTHEHADEEEVYIVLRGRGRVLEAEGPTEVGPGDTVLTGDGASHAVENIGSEPLEMVAFIVRY
ncbi:MAG: cupin domain-containing protein [Lentisphaeria bacterium]|nr:cupin domain-containing protein [Lentisphaeria bacterium]